MSKWTDLEYELLMTNEWYAVGDTRKRFIDAISLHFKRRVLPVFDQKVNANDEFYALVDLYNGPRCMVYRQKHTD